MGILLGLAAALGWGVADFMARFASRRVGAYRTLMFMQLIGFLLLSAGLGATGHWSRFFPAFAWQVWAWAVLAGLLNALSSFLLYRSFEVGLLALVSPIAASYPALTVLLSLASGEKLTLLHGLGVGAAIFGVILAAAARSAPDPAIAGGDPHRHLFRGVPWALSAAVGYGLLFWMLGFRVMPEFGGAASVWIIRITTFSTLALLALPLGQSIELPRGSTFWLVFGVGVMDTAAFLANNLALKHAEVSIASVLSSLYGAVTVLLAAVFLHEKLERTQWLGIAVIFIGIALVSI